MKPQRLKWIDYARGIAIILVVYRHAFEGIKQAGLDVAAHQYLEQANILFFSFRMPLFFIVSGVFVSMSLQKRGFAKFINNKARTILYPYFLWGIIQISIQILFSQFTNYPTSPYNYLYLLYQPRELAQFWYLLALFNVSVLYVILKKFARVPTLLNIGIGLVFYFISAVLYQQSIDLGFVNDILHYYIFIGVGDGISKFITNRDNFKYFESAKLSLLLLLPFAATQIYFLMENMQSTVEKYMYVEYYQPALFLIIALVGCMFIMNISFVLQRLHILKWLHNLGRHSLYIYVAHVICFAAIRVLATRFLHIENVPLLLFICIIGGLLIPIAIYQLSKRLGMEWLFSLEKNKKNEDATKELKVNMQT